MKLAQGADWRRRQPAPCPAHPALADAGQADGHELVAVQPAEAAETEDHREQRQQVQGRAGPRRP